MSTLHETIFPEMQFCGAETNIQTLIIMGKGKIQLSMWAIIYFY